MNAAALIVEGAHDDAPITLKRDERLAALFMPIRDMPPVMAAIVAGSLALHAVVLVTAVVTARAPLAAPKEIAVEVVQEAPKQALKEAPKETPKPTTPPPAKPPEQPKAVATTAPADAPKPPAPPAASPQPKAPAPDLEKELSSLRAEQAALKTQLAADDAEAKTAASGKAVALAATGEGDGDPVGYQMIVFSQLAKAKDGDGFKGAVGTTGVRFEITATGALAGVEVVTPSGDPTLDREAVAIVRRAAPFPPPPKDAERSIFANVNFVAPKR